MSDQTYQYVTCDCCMSEVRKEHIAGCMGGGRDVPPAAWLLVCNRDQKKLWDICPECAKEFTTWLLRRAGHIVDEQATKKRIRDAVDAGGSALSTDPDMHGSNGWERKP